MRNKTHFATHKNQMNINKMSKTKIKINRNKNKNQTNPIRTTDTTPPVFEAPKRTPVPPPAFEAPKLPRTPSPYTPYMRPTLPPLQERPANITDRRNTMINPVSTRQPIASTSSTSTRQLLQERPANITERRNTVINPVLNSFSDYSLTIHDLRYDWSWLESYEIGKSTEPGLIQPIHNNSLLNCYNTIGSAHKTYYRTKLEKDEEIATNQDHVSVLVYCLNMINARALNVLLHEIEQDFYKEFAVNNNTQGIFTTLGMYRFLK